MKRHYGWRPDKPDFRDRRYTAIAPRAPATLPPHFSLREKMPAIIDQGDIGSCTACSISTALMYERDKQDEKPDFRPSILFIYYNERREEGTTYFDAGAEIRTGIKTVAKTGFCGEEYWPYNVQKYKRRPTLSAYWNAKKYKAVEYYRLNNTKINDLKQCIVSGHPFIFGFSIFDSIEKADTNGGLIEMPTPNSSMDGGHAVVCCGYDDEKQLFQIHNSWGTEVGDKGYFYIPYDFITNTDLADDFWTIRKTQETDGI